MTEECSPNPDDGSNSDLSDEFHIEPLSNAHIIDGFDSGNNDLNMFLHTHAMKNTSLDLSQTFVMINRNGDVVGFYTLAWSSVVRGDLPTAKLRKQKPATVTFLLIARLAVHKDLQGNGLGSILLLDAISKATRAASLVPAPFIGVHPKTVRLEKWYTDSGFELVVKSAPHNLHLMTLATAGCIVSATSQS